VLEVHLDPDAVIHGFLDRVEEALAGKHVREVLDQIPGVPCGMPLVAALTAVIVDTLVIGIAVLSCRPLTNASRRTLSSAAGALPQKSQVAVASSAAPMAARSA
jgi:hypothetical protein